MCVCERERERMCVCERERQQEFSILEQLLCIIGNQKHYMHNIDECQIILGENSQKNTSTICSPYYNIDVSKHCK